MSIWADRRKNTIIAIAIFIGLIPVGIVIYSYLNKPLTCSDNKQNQGESGVDCGGPCSLVCKKDALNLIVSWQRLFKVAPGLYTATAYIENPNVGAGAKEAHYVFKIYGEEGIVVYERKGSVHIYPKNTFAIVEPGIETGERKVSRMTFEFTEEPTWTKENEYVSPFTITNREVIKEDTAPRIEATLQNATIDTYTNVAILALVYGADGNAMAASRTVVDRIEKNGKAPLVFTWPQPFSSSISRIEIIPEF